MLWFLISSQASAATFFVRTGATGSNNGSNWANAWTDLSNIKWTLITPGSVVCITGGTYSGSLITGANGTSANPISVKRAVASDPGCGSASVGWNASYDAQVRMTGTITLRNDYVAIDGGTDNGMTVIMQNPNGSNYSGISVGAPTNGVTLRYIEVSGPCGPTPCNQNGDHRSISLNRWNGSTYDLQNNMTMQHLNLHGACNLLWSAHSTNLLIEYSRFADSSDSTPGNPYCHPNVIATQDSTNVTFRYNEITNWEVEGIMACPSGPCASSWDIYGNLWHNPLPGYHRILESQYNSNGPYRFYNNTIVNVTYLCANTANGGSFASGTQGRNNLFWNSKAPCGLPSDDYDFANRPLNEAHGRGNGSNPFVNLAARDYRLVDTIGPTYPRNAGLDLSSLFSVDLEGKGFGLDGLWDIGAYEYGSAPTVVVKPNPPQNLTTRAQ